MSVPNENLKEIIVIRSLTDSDLGIFATHRSHATSKQRAVNINVPIARRIVASHLFEVEETHLDCISSFKEHHHRERRSFKKVHKNWRLGGKKIEGTCFGQLDSKDFMLLRTVEYNDGEHPVYIKFIGKNSDPVVHAGIAAILEKKLSRSMAVIAQNDDNFEEMAKYCPNDETLISERKNRSPNTSISDFPPMPVQKVTENIKPRSMKEKLRQPHIIEQMLHVAADLSAPAQLRFIETVESLASTLRELLILTNRLVSVPKNHGEVWKKHAGKPVGFVDGGLANLKMLGSVPIAARVGAYTVIPGDHTVDREDFRMMNCLINELYTNGDENQGVFSESFPDPDALRDAARISIEAAGVVQLLTHRKDLDCVLLHGSLVSPVSRYTDLISMGQIRHRFPDFSEKSLEILLPEKSNHKRLRGNNFINTYLKQLEYMQTCEAVVCGVVERSGSTTTTCKALLDSFSDSELRPLLPESPEVWRRNFRRLIDPSEDDEMEGQRITDTLLFRCILEPGEAILPVAIERNLLRKAPRNWSEVIARYPNPWVTYLQPSEWSNPIRIEFFEKDLGKFMEIIELIRHCSLLLPKYSFPVGLDIADKFVKIPNWMSSPVNAYATVSAMKQTLDSGDSKSFDSLRKMLCGSNREWLYRPGIYRNN